MRRGVVVQLIPPPREVVMAATPAVQNIHVKNKLSPCVSRSPLGVPQSRWTYKAPWLMTLVKMPLEERRNRRPYMEQKKTVHHEANTRKRMRSRTVASKALLFSLNCTVNQVVIEPSMIPKSTRPPNRTFQEIC